MSLRTELARLNRDLGQIRIPRREYWSVTVMRVDQDPEHRPPGFYGKSLHLDVVYDGDEPPPLPKDRLASHCIVITFGPDFVEPPTEPPFAESPKS